MSMTEFAWKIYKQQPPFGAKLSADVICSEKRTELDGTDNIQGQIK